MSFILKVTVFIIVFTRAYGVSPLDVVSSSLKHFPKVIESVQKLEEKKNLTKEARGAFDTKLKGEISSRMEGYYSGDAYKTSIEKPFPFLGSKIYGGRRQGFGEFPVYENHFETLNRGETFAGISVSLLRNSLIDMNRYNLRYRKEDEAQADLSLKMVKVNVQTMALKAYWTWLIKGQEFKVYKNILELAQVRAKQIARRIKSGDLAKIYQSENNQYIRKREAQVTQNQLEFQEATFYLSLFYRNSKGTPISLSQKNLPLLKEKQLKTIKTHQPVFDEALARNLNMQILDSREKQANLDMSLGKNEILPRIDVNLEWSRDQGIGPSQLSRDENKIMFNLEIPLQFRKGLGKRKAAKQKINQLKIRKQWTKERLLVKVKSLIVKLNALAKIYDLTLDQVKLAQRLSKAEYRKFSQGASDLILVNIREENLAEAQIKNLSSLLKYHFIDAEVQDIRVNLITQ